MKIIYFLLPYLLFMLPFVCKAQIVTSSYNAKTKILSIDINNNTDRRMLLFNSLIGNPPPYSEGIFLALCDNNKESIYTVVVDFVPKGDLKRKRVIIIPAKSKAVFEINIQPYMDNLRKSDSASIIKYLHYKICVRYAFDPELKSRNIEIDKTVFF